MNSFKCQCPRFLVIAVEAAAMFLTACSGSGGSNITPPPPPQQVSMPSASPAAGTYSVTQDVVLSSTTTGAVIYYTTDGSVPTSTSKKYSKPISVSVSSTIKAYATAVSYDDSGVLSAAYTNVPAPTITSVSPTTVKSTGTYTFDLFGGGYSARNDTNVNQWHGTVANSYLVDSSDPKCPTSIPADQAGGADTSWVSDTHIQQWDSGTSAVGVWYYWVANFPAADGTGGGFACLNNAYTVTANNSNVVSGMVVQLQPATQDQKADALNFYSQEGTLQHSIAIPAGTTSVSVVGAKVYAPNLGKHLVTVIDSNMALSSFNTGEFKPVFVVGDSAGRLYIAAHVDGDNSRGVIVRYETGGSLTKVIDADGFGDLQVSVDNSLFWPAGNLVHILDLSSGSEHTVDLGRRVDSLHQLSSGEVAVWQTGETKVSFIDLSSLRETAQVEVPAGIYGYSGDYLSLANGNIGKISVTGFQKVGTAPVDELYGGFSVVRSKCANPVVYTVAGKNRKLRSITP